MSACRCAHCSATGHCKCLRCMEAERGAHYVNQFQMNMAVTQGVKMGVEANGGEFPLIGLLFISRLLAGARQAEETYLCSICRGRGYNYIGGRR